MQFTFLEARNPLTKKFTATSKEPYPNAFEFRSHVEKFKNLTELTSQIQAHAALGHCLLKGELSAPLGWESRAGRTNPHQTTRWICLDIDSIASVTTPEAFMAKIGLPNVSYIRQWSASYGVTQPSQTPGSTSQSSFALKCHLFVLTTTSISPSALKIWLKHLNLTHFTQDLALTKTNTSLSWPLDITTCQNDKLLFISPPDCTPPSLNQFTGTRIELITKANDYLDFGAITSGSAPLPSAEQIKAMEETEINRLRKLKNLPERKASQFKLKEFKGETYLSSPDQATLTSIKEERGYTYLNLNGGDSWGYYHPTDNPTFVYNFKGEPTYKTSELLPDYWSSTQNQKRQTARSEQVGKTFFAFRDFRSAEYYNGWYDEATDELTLHQARSEKQLQDFLANYAQPVPDSIPIWSIVYDPKAPVLDLVNKTVNTFRPSTYMKFSASQAKVRKPAPFPVITKVITSVVGASMYDHLINWLAYMYQQRTSPGTAWVWHGTQGTGKGILMNQILQPIFGQSNVALKRMEELEDKFNPFMENSLLVSIDEAQISDSPRNRMINSNLKIYITEPRISIRQMRQPAYEVTNHCGLIFSSNMADAVIIAADDRRFNVGEYQKNKLQISQAEIQAIKDELQDFANHLELYKVDVQQVRTPKSNDAKDQMIQISMTSADTIASALLKGDLSILWDALPTVDASMLDPAAAIKLLPYKQLVYDLITTRREKITREELFAIFNYNVGNVPSSPWKLSTYLKHHGVVVKDIRMGEKIVKGVIQPWTNPPEWFDERMNEIIKESGPKVKQIHPPTQAKQA